MTIIDNLDNAFQVAYQRMQDLAGDKAKSMKFIKVGLFKNECLASVGTI